ncbi:lysophospholipid acyltransferase family protein [Maricaulis maris]|uniref:1-acyl-sn-glycerol-3-phosphate acyltransferase n=1 Tax=Maricaulis maris TaxID=74318 RepID=A0A495D4N5_9PROT|nr:1-acyl-sn-glycerol-3-phosphate acyltransferase [Maricaulis maris]RKQ95511.1 1-acyl-sn-glycerol-3-phosphate acyltransferase [Maricaulis maris]
MRSLVFNLLFWPVLVVFALIAWPVAFTPWSRGLKAIMRTACRTVRALMKWVLGAPVEVRGPVPTGRPVIIAAKHQSWADGFLMMAVMGDINFVIGNEISKFPLIGRIVRASGATMVNSPGLTGAQGALADAIKRAADDPRPLLIYPEGRLPEVGESYRYRKGVHLMYETLGRHVVPVATNTGLRWPQNRWRKHPGPAVIEFLGDIPPGLPRDDFLPRLKMTIETRTRALEAEGQADKEARS